MGVKISRSSLFPGAIVSDPKTAEGVSISIYPTEIYIPQFSVSSPGKRGRELVRRVRGGPLAGEGPNSLVALSQVSTWVLH